MSKALVIIPTYNEKENIQALIETIFSLPEPFDILIVDDNSPDGTAQIVKQLQNKYPQRLFLEVRPEKQGLGMAYLHGFQWALQRNYEYIFEMDADFSHDPKDLIRLYQTTKKGYDLVIGSRYVNNLVNVVNWPMGRVLLSYFASKYVRFITGMPIYDTTAGFKCYRARVLKAILQHPPRFVGYAFQIEMKFRAWKYGFKIKEIPIVFTDRRAGTSKMNKKIIREAIFGVIKMKIASWFRKYEVPAD